MCLHFWLTAYHVYWYKMYKKEHLLALRDLYFIQEKSSILKISFIFLSLRVCAMPPYPHSATHVENQNWILFVRVKALKEKKKKIKKSKCITEVWLHHSLKTTGKYIFILSLGAMGYVYSAIATGKRHTESYSNKLKQEMVNDTRNESTIPELDWGAAAQPVYIMAALGPLHIKVLYFRPLNQVPV